MLLVIPGGRGPKESQTDAVRWPSEDAMKELEGLQDPGSGTTLKEHLLRGAKGHQGDRGGVHSLWEKAAESAVPGRSRPAGRGLACPPEEQACGRGPTSSGSCPM